MSRRKIFEGVRRRPVDRRRFLLAADVMEERTLLSYLVPSQIRHAYGVDQITFTGPGGAAIQGDGAGQTIAILGLGNDPTINAVKHITLLVDQSKSRAPFSSALPWPLG